MRSVTLYQPRTMEAGFTMLGRLSKHEGRLLSSLLAHKAEEAETPFGLVVTTACWVGPSPTCHRIW